MLSSLLKKTQERQGLQKREIFNLKPIYSTIWRYCKSLPPTRIWRDFLEVYAPVVSWSIVNLMLLLSTIGMLMTKEIKLNKVTQNIVTMITRFNSSSMFTVANRLPEIGSRILCKDYWLKDSGKAKSIHVCFYSIVTV